MEIKPQIPKPSTAIEWNETLAAWTVWRYEEVNTILKDARFSANATSVKDSFEASNAIHANLSSYRPHFSQTIQKKSTWSKSQMTKIAEEICHSIKAGQIFDFQQKIVLPWCQKMARTLTGIEVEKREMELLLQYANTVFLMTDGNNKPKAETATIALSQFFLQLMEKRSQFPKDDLVSLLVQNKQAHSMFLSPTIQLFVGFVTSLPLLLGNALLTLLTQPNFAQRFVKEPTRWLNELLRYAGPAQFVYRLAATDVQVGEHTFKSGDRLALLLSHANRDADIFNEPNLLDLKQNKAINLSLGRGTHACLGSPLIRDACMILPSMLLNSLEDLQPTIEEVKFGGSRAICGVKVLKIRV